MISVKPYLIIGPGDFIEEEKAYRNWSNEDLSQVLGLSMKTVCELLNNRQRITIGIAHLLGKTFGQSPQYWINLGKYFRF